MFNYPSTNVCYENNTYWDILRNIIIAIIFFINE